MPNGFSQILKNITQGTVSTVYGLDGEEGFYLDQLAEAFENKLLPEGERDFNLTIFYGKDADWQEVINACRRFPMFAARQVVLLKDAAQLKNLQELVGYVTNPSPTTVFVIEHRGKKFDSRSKLAKALKSKGVVFTAEKVKEENIPEWIVQYGKSQQLIIDQKAAELISTFLGNDLQKVANEIEKVKLNLKEHEALTPELVQQYIGISKEYNLFELPEVFASGNLDKFSRMLTYFIANPKNAPMVLIIGSFYSFFNTLYLTLYTYNRSDKDAATAMRSWPSRVKSMRQIANRWPLPKTEQALLLIAQYSAATVGVAHYAKDAELLKEFIGKMRMLEAG